MAETLNTYKEPASNPNAEHDAAMLAKAETLENAGSERPEWLPEKFKSAEDMAKAYSELEKKMSQPKDETPKDEQDTAPEAADANQVKDALDNVGIDFNSLQDEYNAEGGLTDASYKELEQKGFSRDLVDSWIKGQEALAQDLTQSIYSSVGGEEQYGELMSWASQNLPPNEIDAFNRTVDSGDIATTKLAVQGLQARYRSEVGTEPKLLKGESASSSSGAFQSAAELTAAMRDPRYHSDPAYRRSVAEKLAKSNVF